MNRPDIDLIETFFLVAAENTTTMSKMGIDSVLELVEWAKTQEARVEVLVAEKVKKSAEFLAEIDRTHKICIEWRERGDKAEACVAELEKDKHLLREDNAGLLAAADADAFVIGNLNARVAVLGADKSEEMIQFACDFAKYMSNKMMALHCGVGGSDGTDGTDG